MVKLVDVLRWVLYLAVIFGFVFSGYHWNSQKERLELENLNLETELNMAESKLDEVWSKKLSLEKDIIDLQRKNKRLENRIEKLKSGYESNISSLESRLERMNGYYIPTREELELVVDKTNVSEYSYREKEFTCMDFSTEMVQQLHEHNINSCVTSVVFNNYSGSHHFVSVKTTDGIVYLEPQTGKFVKDFSLGSDFCDIMGLSDCTREVEKYSNCYEKKVIDRFK